MTDKQIIIDGVNVLNCGHYSQFEGETENACYIMQKTFLGKEEISKEFCSCETNPNCYYKQLKRKEKECERLKHDNGYEVGALEKTIDNLKAENEILEKDKANLDVIIETLKAQFNQLKAEKDHYKQNLKNIYKLFIDFANEDIITCPDLSPSENYKIILEQFRTVLVKVLNKSGEALND